MSGEYTALAHETAATLERLSRAAGTSISEIKRLIMAEHDRQYAQQAQDEKGGRDGK